MKKKTHLYYVILNFLLFTFYLRSRADDKVIATMGLLVKDKDNPLYNDVLIHATKNTSYINNFPKTRRIVNRGNEEYDTLGWVKLILEGQK